MLTRPFTILAANCVITASTVYALAHPLGVRSSMQIAPPSITNPFSILGEITLMKGGANGKFSGKITCSSMWGISSSRISAASSLSGSILCNRTCHSNRLSFTSSAVKVESRWCCILWISLSSFISRRKPFSAMLIVYAYKFRYMKLGLGYAETDLCQRNYGISWVIYLWAWSSLSPSTGEKKNREIRFLVCLANLSLSNHMVIFFVDWVIDVTYLRGTCTGRLLRLEETAAMIGTTRTWILRHRVGRSDSIRTMMTIQQSSRGWTGRAAGSILLRDLVGGPKELTESGHDLFLRPRGHDASAVSPPDLANLDLKYFYSRYVFQRCEDSLHNIVIVADNESTKESLARSRRNRGVRWSHVTIF